MHEISIISSVIQMVEENSLKNNITKVSKVILQIGEFSCIEDSSMKFAFEALSQGSICEKADLELDRIRGRAYCSKCSKEFNVGFTRKTCPDCNETSSEITSGYEILLYRIEGE
ncbi:MAG: hydrogenase maturation nickel metallochaperone HypA [Clostridium sp.]